MATCFPNVDNGLVRLVIRRSIHPRCVCQFLWSPQREYTTTSWKRTWPIPKTCGVYIKDCFFVLSSNGCAENKQRNEPVVSSGAETNTNNDRFFLLLREMSRLAFSITFAVRSRPSTQLPICVLCYLAACIHVPTERHANYLYGGFRFVCVC